MIERDLEVDGCRLHYRSAGSGPPLLLLHALSESSYSWSRVMPALGTAHTVLAPDLPGFADSDRSDGDPTPQHFADVAAGFLRTLDVGPATIVGNSLGGSAAIHLALRHPDHVARLVLVASVGLGRYVHPALRAMALPGYGDIATAFGRTFLGAAQRAWLRVPLLFTNPALAPLDWLAEQQRLAQTPQHLTTTLAALRAQVSPFGQRQLLLAELPRLKIPTLVLWGADDKVLPVSQAQAAMAQLRHGDLAVIPACGHLPQLERPKQFVTVIDRFLQTAQ